MVTFGIIGTNWITETLVQAALLTGKVKFTAVYSRTEEKGREFAEKFGIAHVYTDLEAFGSSPEFEAVYIASPNSLHARYAVQMMDHGKHVLCEKPIASHAREVKGMIGAAKRNGVLLMEAVKSTFMPGFRAVQENLHKIGPIRRYTASYGQYSSRYDAYKQGTVLNAFKPEFSNGSLMDLGVYCIYPMVVLFGKPERVQAEAVMLESGVDGEGSLLLKYGGMDAVIMHSKIANSYLPAEIQGELGTLVIDRINEPGRVEIRYKDGRVEDLTQPTDQPSMYYEVMEFTSLLEEGKTESSVNSLEVSLAAMEVIEEARRQIGLVFPADSQG
ncbi:MULTISPECIES: Gfo/Idh/MocA family protein [Paenibacillus]|uniref:Gfo/Idh/MocA family protein n=1 Tax=Paenibacillus TaxID=44249 RepID=UPI0022B93C18|nr:Gfo/Idh/MocA family oxidoreductase [Paenibacillus caseinilyticus]MCZ8522477.1 Gfo/Idh/MocA family oxidoreductase [Paenibacillus caseinilyticus]